MVEKITENNFSQQEITNNEWNRTWDKYLRMVKDGGLDDPSRMQGVNRLIKTPFTPL